MFIDVLLVDSAGLMEEVDRDHCTIVRETDRSVYVVDVESL